ncbi:MAG: T9SS type A sorting domain-containing protein [Candidatus Cloacimonadaceae bacterium]
MKRASFIILLLAVCIGLAASMPNNMESVSYNGSDRNSSGPYNLMAQIIGVNDVLLVWENPVYLNLPMGYRIYCDGCLVTFISGAYLSDYLLENVCDGCHQIYVAAYYDTGCESPPSNIIEINITSNADNHLSASQMELLIYPNPSRGSVNVALSGMEKNEPTSIEIYNVKGQLVSKNIPTLDSRWLWDGKTISGNRATEGIYFVKAANSQGIVTQKLILVR